ncbi:hypothetical protein VHUM_04325 [Vanrija humicola]|uniref:Gamma-glutamyltransferase n=1 Tax=Vanrija humicola TaxID=5417 RepID=A0A7D8UY64_VANHU|nr:hypothetical protein VHUM_04325 [Vanrija humicola]
MRDKGGSAVDAGIASALCVGMINAFESGIGGGGFMVVKPTPGTGEAAQKSINYREVAPAGASQDMYAATGRNGSQIGGLAVGVPGELRGWEKAHKLGGRLPWHDVVQPVADLGNNGWKVSKQLASVLAGPSSAFMKNDPLWAEIYWPNGAPAKEGDTIYRKKYAAALAKIAKEGADAFYTGAIADDIIKATTATKGILTHGDLANYTAVQDEAISTTFRGKTVHTMNAPSSGLVMLGLLNIYEPYFGEDECWSTNDMFHRLESMRFAFGARTKVSDPAFNPNVTLIESFKTKEWADEQRAKITDKTHDPAYYGMTQISPEDHGTTHVSVLDSEGGAFSATTTVNLAWGSHVMTPEYGIILNNQMDDFAVPGAPDAFGLAPQAANFIAPGKRPLSSTAPTIIEDGEGNVVTVIGGAGGSRIFPGVAQAILNLECGDDVNRAIQRPRWHSQLSPNVTTLEVGVGADAEPKDVVRGLEDKGYYIGLFDLNYPTSNVLGVTVTEEGVYAASDSRLNGVAAVY